MKRLLLFVAFVCLASTAHAQLLKQSTATTVNVKLTNISDGADATGVTVTGITLKFVKQSDTLASTATAVTCAASGSSNDCVEVAAGVYNIELSATDTNTLGRLEVCALESGSYTDCRGFQVVPSGFYDLAVTTGPSTVPTNFAAFSIDANGRIDVIKIAGTTQTAGDIPATLALHDTFPRGVAYSNFPVWIMSNSTGAGIASLTNITCRISKDGGAWATTNDTTETEVGGSGAGRGMYLIDLTNTETTADTFAVECVSATANTSTYRTSITTQH